MSWKEIHLGWRNCGYILRKKKKMKESLEEERDEIV